MQLLPALCPRLLSKTRALRTTPRLQLTILVEQALLKSPESQANLPSKRDSTQELASGESIRRRRRSPSAISREEETPSIVITPARLLQTRITLTSLMVDGFVGSAKTTTSRDARNATDAIRARQSQTLMESPSICRSRALPAATQAERVHAAIRSQLRTSSRSSRLLRRPSSRSQSSQRIRSWMKAQPRIVQ